MAGTEVWELRELVQEGGKGYFTGSRSWVCDASDAGSVSLALYDSTWPGSGGSDAPVCKKTHARYLPSGQVGQALVTAYYSTPRKTGRARVITRTECQWEKIIREPEGQKRIIEGPDPANEFAWWVVTRGDNIVQTFETVIEIQTAAVAADFRLADVLALKKSVNGDPLTISGFGTIPAEKALLAGVDTSREYGQGLIDVDYLLLYSGPDETWNDRVKVQQGCWIVEEVPSFSGGLDTTSATESALVFKPGKKAMRQGTEWVLADAAEESRACFTKKPFGAYMSGLTEW